MNKWIILLFVFITANSYSSLINDTKMLLESEKNTVNIYQEASLSVVNVSNIKVARNMWDFTPVEIPRGAGSGYVWDKQGHIVTNFHVVHGGDSFRISFKNDKTEYKAKVVGVAPEKDIAVLKIVKPPKNLIPIKKGSSKKLMVGQKAIAIGNPFGLDHSMSSGIVSALGRKIKGIAGRYITNMIQTDAAINQGNSGGPLLNSSGELIGMNTMIFSTSGSSAGIGFAVPADTIKRIVPQIINNGKVIRPALGITLLAEHVVEGFGIEKGVVVFSVKPGSGADKAGLKGAKRLRSRRIILGDIILEIDGKKVNNHDDIYQVLDSKKVGDAVMITIEREERIMKKEVKLSALTEG